MTINRNDTFGAAANKESGKTIESLREEIRALRDNRDEIQNLIRELIPVAKFPTLPVDRLPDTIIDAVIDCLTEYELLEIEHWTFWASSIGREIQDRLRSEGMPAEVQKAIDDWSKETVNE